MSRLRAALAPAFARALARAFALVLSASVAHAACGGADIRPTLSPAETAQLRAYVDATPYGVGNYWIATRGAQTLHVIGTIHVDDPRLDPIMTRLAPVIASAGHLYVEATAEEEAKLENAVLTRPELLFLTDGPTLPELMPEDDWQALLQAAQDRGLPGFMIAKYQPWFLSLMLSMPACAVAEMVKGVRGLDHKIMEHASASNIPQSALEPYDTLFKLMGEDPLERQIDFLTLGILPNDVAENALATLKAQYFEENPAEIFEFSRILAHQHVDLPAPELDALVDEMFETLLNKRNTAWMPALLNAPDGVSVVAVGAGHLPGEYGVLNLLANAGFALKRDLF